MGRRKTLKQSLSEIDLKIAQGLVNNIDKISDTFLMLGTAYYGTLTVPHDKIKGAFLGALGYKLATATSGMPPVSQAAGVALLAGMGLASLPIQSTMETRRQSQGPLYDLPALIERIKLQFAGS